MMKQTTKRLLLSMAALILSVGAVCTSYAASDKRKVGKMDLVFDSDLGIGVDGNSYSVTVDGANTDRYYISDTEVVNEDSDDFSDSNPPEIEVTLAVADEDQWYFASASSDAFRLNLAASSKNRYDKVQFVSAKRSEKNTMLTLRVKLIYERSQSLIIVPPFLWRRMRHLRLPASAGTALIRARHPGIRRNPPVTIRFSWSETASTPASCVRYTRTTTIFLPR